MSSSKSSPTPKPRALIVDDNMPFARAIARILRGIGFEAAISESGAEALSRIRSGERFVLVVSDVYMPGMDGGSFHSAARVAWPEIDERLVFVSGAAHDQLPPNLAAPVFSKPVGVDFYAHVRSVLDKARHAPPEANAMVATTMLTPENLRRAASQYGLDLALCAPYISWASSPDGLTRIDSGGAGPRFREFLAYLVDHGWAQEV